MRCPNWGPAHFSPADTWEGLGLPASFTGASTVDAMGHAVTVYNRCLALLEPNDSATVGRVHAKIGNAFNIIGVQHMNAASQDPAADVIVGPFLSCIPGFEPVFVLFLGPPRFMSCEGAFSSVV